MKQMLHIALVLVGALALPSAANPQHPLGTYLERLLLVRAQVDSIVGVQHGRSVSRQVIRQVFCGVAVTEGDTFVASSVVGNGGDSIGFSISPPLEVNEEGIWLLVIKGGVLGRQQFGGWGVEYPARQGEPARYDAATHLAEEVRSVWNLTNESERLERVSCLAETGSGEAQLWAITALANTYPNRLRELLKTSIQKQGWGMRALMAVDQAFCDAGGVDGDWRMSDDRSMLLDSVASKEPIDDKEILALVLYVRTAVQRRLMTCGQAAKPIRSITVGKRASAETVLAAVDVLGIVVKEEQCKDAIDLICEILETDQRRTVRAAAISALRAVHQVSESQRARLERIVADLVQAAKGLSPDDREAEQLHSERVLLQEVLQKTAAPK